MNLFKKIALIGKINKGIKEIKKLKDANNPVVDEIIEIINDFIKLLERLKVVVPQIAELIEEIINIIKKIFHNN